MFCLPVEPSLSLLRLCVLITTADREIDGTSMYCTCDRSITAARAAAAVQRGQCNDPMCFEEIEHHVQQYLHAVFACMGIMTNTLTRQTNQIKRSAAGLGYGGGYGYAGHSRNRAVAWVGGFRRQPAIFNALVRRRGGRPAYPQKVCTLKRYTRIPSKYLSEGALLH